jgi:hypothetical protein
MSHKTRNERNTSVDPFREVNWRKVDEYRATGLSWSAVSISWVMDYNIPYNALRAAKARRAEKRVERLSANHII